MAASPTGNTYELVLEASDQASQIVESVKATVLDVGRAALVAQQNFLTWGTAITALSGTSLQKLRELGGVIGLIQTTLNTPIGKGIVTSIREAAEEATKETRSLTEVLGAIGATGTPLLEGLILGDSKGVEQKSTAIAGRISQSLVQAGLQGGAGLGLALEKGIDPALRLVEKNFGDVGGILSGSIRASLQGDLFNIVLSKGIQTGLNTGFEEFVSGKLPGVLKGLSGPLAGVAKNLLPGDAKELLSGNLAAGLESLIARKIGDGLIDGFRTLDAASIAAVPGFEKAGGLAGKLFASGFKVSSISPDIIDSLIPKGAFGDVIRNTISGPLSGALEAGLQNLDPLFQKAFAAIAQNLKGGDGIFASLRTQFVSVLGSLDQASNGLVTDIGVRTGSRLGVSFASGFGKQVLSGVGAIANEIDSLLLKSIHSIEQIPGRLSGAFGGVSQVFEQVAEFGNPLKVFSLASGVITGFTEKVTQTSYAFFQLTQGFQALQSFVQNGPFESLIGQNIKLREQLLSTQSTLVGTNKIIQDGTALKDPTQAIQSLDGPVKNAIAELRQGSLELVNVTSKDLIDSFQIIAGQAGNIGFSLKDAKDLTLSFGAALGTLGVPLSQARQEITSILQGTIDQNSIVAKSLGINNQMIATYKSQGTLVAELSKRLEAFRAGNKLAADQIGGITSNLQELIDNIGLAAGDQLIKPIVSQLQELYDYVNKNKDVLVANVTNLVAGLASVGESAVEIVKDVFNATAGIFATIPKYLIGSLANGMKELAEAVKTTLDILRPALETFTALAQQVGPLAGGMLKLFLQFKALQIGIGAVGQGFGILSSIVPGIGELLFLVDKRSSGLVNTFASLSSTLVGRGGAGFLLLGQNLAAIPGAAGLVASRLGVLGPLVTGLIPQASGLAIQVLGLTKSFPPLQGVLQGLTAQLPGVINQLAGVAGSSNFAGGAFASLAPSLNNAAKELSVYTKGTDIATLLNEKFTEATKAAGVAIRNQIIGFGLLAAGVFAAFYVVDNYILKNKELMEIIGAIGQGLKTLASLFTDILTNPVTLATIAISGLVVALLNYEKVLLALRAIKIGGFFQDFIAGAGGAAGALAKLSGLLKGVGFAGMATDAGIASAAIAGASGAAAAGTLTFKGLAIAVKDAVLSLAALALPVAAVAAAIALIGLYAYSRQLKDSTKATEELGRQADETADNVLQFANKLKAAKDRQEEANRKGLRLSKEEYEQNAALQSQAKQRIGLIEEELKQLEAGKKSAVGDENKNAIQARIDQLTGLKKTLEGLQSGVQIAPQDLPRLGTELEQLAAKAKAAEEAINKSSGDPALFKDKTKELLDSTQKQLALGAITSEEASRRAALVLNNTSAEVEAQEQARSLIAAAYQKADKDIVQSEETRQAKIEQAEAEGTVTATEGAKQVTEAKLKELDEQFENLKAEKDKEIGLEKQATDLALKEVDRKIAEAKQKLAAASGDSSAVTDLANKAIADLTPQKEVVSSQIKEVEDQINAFKAKLPVGGRGTASVELTGQIKTAEEKLSKLRGDLEKVDTQLTAQGKAKANPASVKDDKAAEAALRSLSELEKDKEKIQQESNNRIGQLNDDFDNKEAKNRAEAAKTRAAQEQREIDRADKLAIDAAQKAETEKQIQITKQRQAGKISQVQAAQELEKANAAQIKAELGAEETKLQSLLKNPKRNEDAIRESRLKILSLTKKSLDEEDRLYDAQLNVVNHTQKVALDNAQKAEVERQIQVTKLRQSGKLTQIQANEEIEKSTANQIKSEIDAEEQKLKFLLKNPKRNEDAIRESRIKILNLTKKSLDEEDKLYDAHINVLREKLEQTSKRYANSVEAQNQKLQEQVQIYDLLDQALQQRNQLLNAAKDLSSVTSDYLSSELSILEKGEVSDRKKKQLAEATALIKLETARQQIELENQIAEINEKQRQIALDRKKIENEIAVSRKTVEIQKGGNDITIAQQDLKRGKITQADFDGKILEQSQKQLELQQLLKERGLITQEEALQPLINQAEKQKRDANARKTILSAEAEFADSAPTAAGRRRRNRALGEEFAQEFGLTRPQLSQQVRERAEKAADERFNDGRKNLPNVGTLVNDPNLFGRFNKAGQELERAATKIGAAKVPTLGDVQRDIDSRLKQRGGAGAIQLADPETKRLQLPQTSPSVPASQSQAMEQLLKQMQQQQKPPGEQASGVLPQTPGGVTFNNNFDITIAAGTNDKSGLTTTKAVVLQQFDDITRRAQAIAQANYKV